MEDSVIISAVLLIFGSCGAYCYIKASPYAHYADWMRSGFVSFISTTSGLIGGVLAVYLLITSKGFAEGLFLWFSGGVFFILIINKLRDYIFPLLFMLSMLSTGCGFALLAL